MLYHVLVRMRSHIFGNERSRRLHAAWITVAIALTALIPLIHSQSHSGSHFQSHARSHGWSPAFPHQPPDRDSIAHRHQSARHQSPGATPCGKCAHPHATYPRAKAGPNPTPAPTPAQTSPQAAATPSELPADRHDDQDRHACETCTRILLCLNIGGAPPASVAAIAPAPMCERARLTATRVIDCATPRERAPRGPPIA